MNDFVDKYSFACNILVNKRLIKAIMLTVTYSVNKKVFLSFISKKISNIQNVFFIRLIILKTAEWNN